MKDSFLRLVDEHQRIIHKVSRMYRDNIEDEKDLFQDIVLQLWKSYPNFRGESKASTWIYRIALNTAMAFYRKKAPDVALTPDLPDTLDKSRPDEKSEQEELLYDALHRLEVTDRAIISLFLDEYSYSEIAKIIGISENYVGVKINRIKKRLKELLTENHGNR
ncbi:RNA polymerase sigma factor [Roseivirga sp.]|uniref:RNA polymerase sigma factor n=1 Tax=Roseivirga sp. TaxID=1964215 RepID=UPI003B8D1DEC